MKLTSCHGINVGGLNQKAELSYEVLESIDPKKPLPEDVIEQININLKYEGYIERQQRQIEQFKRWKTRGFRKTWIIMPYPD